MPELPDVANYIEALEARIAGVTWTGTRLASPFLVRTVDPPLSALNGRKVVELRRVGKRIAIGVESGTWAVLHLMIAGRLHWTKLGAKVPGKRGLAAFDFESGSLILTEAGSQRRASLHLVQGAEGLRRLDPGGVEPLAVDRDTFTRAIAAANHTLKRVLTDPHILSGIGNAYSDEILHRARLSPVALSQKLDAAEIDRLWVAMQEVLLEWTDRLRAEFAGKFPENVTAFRPEMAVHGKFGSPCPVCGSKVQRIRYASNETNYCPGCQTGGKLLADRGLSRLLGKDWPRTIEELEMRTAP